MMKLAPGRVVVVLGGLLAVTATSLAQGPGPGENAYQDMTKTFGFVPSFFRAFPEEGISAAWDEMKAIEMNPNSTLPPKTKELIGLAVAAQIPCHYCSYFHMRAGKANGATDEEQKEAIAMAAITRHWSTVITASQIDMTAFKQEVAKMFQHASQQHANGEAEQPITDAASAYKDLQRTFGFVPTFAKQFPAIGIAPAWREAKALEFNPNTALKAKDKALIGLAVSAQIPCNYCVVFEGESARQAGATDDEMKEAVAMAAVTRHWSTVLNGSLIDEAAFRKEVDRIFRTASEKAPKSAKR